MAVVILILKNIQNFSYVLLICAGLIIDTWQILSLCIGK
jgi:hypothetical protein